MIDQKTKKALSTVSLYSASAKEIADRYLDSASNSTEEEVVKISSRYGYPLPPKDDKNYTQALVSFIVFLDTRCESLLTEEIEDSASFDGSDDILESQQDQDIAQVAAKFQNYLDTTKFSTVLSLYSNPKLWDTISKVHRRKLALMLIDTAFEYQQDYPSFWKDFI